MRQATARVRKNVAYFKVNYLIWAATVLAISLLTKPSSLIVLSGAPQPTLPVLQSPHPKRTFFPALGAAWAYVFVVRGDAPLVVGGRALSEREKLLGGAGITVSVIFFLTSVGHVLFSAACVAASGVAIHGALRVSLIWRCYNRC